MAHLVLLLSFLLIFSSGVSCLPKPVIKCPDQYAEMIWYNRATEICRSNHEYYHCLMFANSSLVPPYAEFCQKPERIAKGQYVVFDSNTNTIKHKDCPPERFQPVERKSNAAMAFQCEKRMTSCDLTGEIKCDNGTSYTDRTCRCNFKEGYSLEAVAEDNSDKISCINPLHVILSCIQLDSCAKSQELNKYYTCVDKCPAGFYRPDGDGCHKVPDFVSSTLRPNPTTQNFVTTTVKDKSEEEERKAEGNTTVIVLVIVLVLFAVIFGILVSICVCCRDNLSCRRNKDKVDHITHTVFICCNVNSHNHEINVEEAENVVVGNETEIRLESKDKESYIKGKKKTSRNDREEKTSRNDREENKALLDQKDEEEPGPDSDDSVTPDAPDPEATTPKEIDLNPVNKVAEHSPKADADSTDPKEIVSSKENDTVEKEDSSPDCNEYMKDMKLAAKKKGWEVEDVPKDGSCFYHCVLRLYVSKNGWDVSTLRRKLRKYLESNAKLYKDFVAESWENLLRGTENNKWADHVEIKAMAEMLKVPIIIHKLNSTGDQLEVKEEIMPKNCHVEPLNIGHILVNKEGFHFVALVPMRLTES